jgi:hypothetical protein
MSGAKMEVSPTPVRSNFGGVGGVCAAAGATARSAVIAESATKERGRERTGFEAPAF